MNAEEFTLKIRNKANLYDFLATTNYLPQKAQKPLVKSIYKNIHFISMEKDEVVHHSYRYRKYTSSELLEILEKLLAEKKLKPTGLTIGTLPDQDWLLNAILHVDPTDKHELIGPKKETKINYVLEINPEYFSLFFSLNNEAKLILFRLIKLLKNEPVKSGRNTILTIPKKCKEQSQVLRLSKKIAKQEKKME